MENKGFIYSANVYGGLLAMAAFLLPLELIPTLLRIGLLVVSFILFCIHGWRKTIQEKRNKNEIILWMILFTIISTYLFYSYYSSVKHIKPEKIIAAQSVTIGDMARKLREKPKVVSTQVIVEKPIIQIMKETSPGQFEMEKKEPVTIWFKDDEPEYVLFPPENKLYLKYLVQVFNNTSETRLFRLIGIIDQKKSGLDKWKLDALTTEFIGKVYGIGNSDIEISQKSPALFKIVFCYITSNQSVPTFINEIESLGESIYTQVNLETDRGEKSYAVKSAKLRDKIIEEYRKQFPPNTPTAVVKGI